MRMACTSFNARGCTYRKVPWAPVASLVVPDALMTLAQEESDVVAVVGVGRSKPGADVGCCRSETGVDIGFGHSKPGADVGVGRSAMGVVI